MRRARRKEHPRRMAEAGTGLELRVHLGSPRPRLSRSIAATPAAATARRAGRALRSIERPAAAVVVAAIARLGPPVEVAAVTVRPIPPVAVVAATYRAAAAIPVEEATRTGSRHRSKNFRFLPIGPVPFSGGRAVFLGSEPLVPHAKPAPSAKEPAFAAAHPILSMPAAPLSARLPDGPRQADRNGVHRAL